MMHYIEDFEIVGSVQKLVKMFFDKKFFLCFRCIEPGTELGWDYGYEVSFANRFKQKTFL